MTPQEILDFLHDEEFWHFSCPLERRAIISYINETEARKAQSRPELVPLGMSDIV